MFYSPEHAKAEAENILNSLKKHNEALKTTEDILKLPRLKYILVLKQSLVKLGMNFERAEIISSLTEIDIQPGVDEFVEEELKEIVKETAKTIFKVCQAIDQTFDDPDMVIENTFKIQSPKISFV